MSDKPTTGKAPGPNGHDDIKVVDRRWWVRGEAAGEAEDAGQALRKPTYVEELEAKLRERDAALQDYIAGHRAAAREFEDARVRFRRDVGREVERGKRAILIEMLEIVDNLDRAIEAARSSTASESAGQLLQGVQLVQDQFLKKLESFGVRRMNALGQPFDPRLHEAISTVAASEPEAEGRIVVVVRHGYVTGEEVLRPASVVVAGPSAPPV